MNLFVSYTVRDFYVSEHLLERISDFVSSFSWPFVDLVHNDSVDKQKRVGEELEKADLLLLLKSESVSKSEWVEWELNRARQLGIDILEIPWRQEDTLGEVLNRIEDSFSTLLAFSEK